MAEQKCLAAVLAAGIEHRAVGQHQAHGNERLVGVLRRPAAHAGRIVGCNPADHRRADRRGVGADLAAKGRQTPVRLGADDAGLQCDRTAVFRNG